MIAASLQAVTFWTSRSPHRVSGIGRSTGVHLRTFILCNVPSTTVSFLISIFHEFGMLNTILGTVVVTFLQIPSIHTESNTVLHFVCPVLTA
jgi:hypothetical protein